MPFDKFLIGPFNSGWQNDLVKWLLPEDAFYILKNMYVWRGRLRKRFGGQLMGSTAGSPETQQFQSRLRTSVWETGAIGTQVTTDGAGNFGPSLVDAGYGPFAIGMQFSVGDECFTVYQASGDMYASGSGTAQFDIATGQVAFTGAAPNAPVYFYPALPVMGLWNFQADRINNEPAIAWDTRAAYYYDQASGWEQLGTQLWQGDDVDFFWSTNWIGTNRQEVYLYQNNFNATLNGTPGASDDRMYRYNGALSPSGTWTEFAPYVAPVGPLPSGPQLIQARILIPFQQRLLAFNTIEQTVEDPGPPIVYTNTNYQYRVRWSAINDPISTNSWFNPGTTDGTLQAIGGGVLDAWTEEAIQTVEIIKNRCIVYFESSTWELVYTGNEALPFRWQIINNQIGSQSTFSGINFDKAALVVGNTGFHACNGTNVDRIDQKIPDEIFQFSDYDTGPDRVWGIRDYQAECAYWTFPRRQTYRLHDFPNAVMVYNYQQATWAINDDTITAFGYFLQDFAATWTTEGAVTWQQASFAWNSGTSKQGVRRILAGNQQGFVFVLDTQSSVNAPVLQITNVTGIADGFATLTVINHNLTVGEYVQVKFAQGLTNFNDTIFRIAETTTTTIRIFNPYVGPLSGTYEGCGLLRRVSSPYIQSKDWNPYVKEGRNVYVQRIVFGFLRTPAGSVTVDYTMSSSQQSMLLASALSGSLLGTGSISTAAYDLYPFERTQDTIWHPKYLQTQGESIRIILYFSDDQMFDVDSALTDFQIQGMIIYTNPTSSRLE